ncbi:MAG: DNA polymerase III subunit delta [Clostridiaceae bacterium]|nr:DNA polymerase III subunit delta [Clostridiaceae bacterium]
MISVEKLDNELKQGKLNSIYLLYGEETYFLETCLKKIKTIFGETKQGINEIKIDESNINFDLIPNIETPAFGYEKKLIIARDTGLFKKEGKKKNVSNSEIIEKISNYIKENENFIKESVILIFVEKEVEKNQLYKEIEDKGIICEFQELKPIELINKLKNICKAYKVNVDESTLRYIIECSGTNMQELINEIRKLIEYAGIDGTITKKEIDLLSIKKIDTVIFDLTDNLGKKRIDEALKVLNGLIYQKEPIQKILIMLYNHFKKLYMIKIAQRENQNIADILVLKPTQTFLMTKYKTQASFFKEAELKKIIEELINLDYNYKIGKIDINVGLESILCNYCS